MKAYLTAKEIYAALEITKQALSLRALRESWPFEARSGLGGKTRYYELISLPPEVQLVIKKYQSGADSPDCDDALPVLDKVCLLPVTFGTGEGRLPDWADNIARARCDLIHQYLEFRLEAKSRGEKVVSASVEFVQQYNTGKPLPSLYKTLGKVSRSTIERWRKDLSDSKEDYRALAPLWGKAKKGKHSITEWEEKILFDQLAHQNRVPVGTAIKLTKYLLETKGINSPSSPSTMRRAVERFKKQHFDLWTFYREGEKALKDKVLPYIERDDSHLEVGDVLVADGHRCNFQVVHPFTGKPFRPMMVAYYDWKSRVLVGWAFSFEENVQVISAALRNSIIRLGKIPKLVLQDNGKAFRAKIFHKDVDFEQCGIRGMFAKLGIKAVFAMPYNARAKVIERFFRDFGNSFERYLATFTGASIEDKPASMMRNEKLMQKLYSAPPIQVPKANAALEKWWQFHAQQQHPTIKGQTRGEVFEEGKGSGVDENQLRFLMMDAEVANLGRNGIRFLKADYWSDALYGLREKVIVRYDFSDISTIYVYNKDGDFLGEAERQKAMHPMAAHLGNAKDVEELKFKTSQVKSLQKQTTKLAKQAIEMNGNTNMINEGTPWDKVVPLAPKLPEAIQQIQDEHDGARAMEQIRVIDASGLPELPATPEPEVKKNIVPIYTTGTEKFYALLEIDELNADDQEFFDDFKKTDMGKQILKVESKQIKRGQRD